jgi:hypothetical protein
LRPRPHAGDQPFACAPDSIDRPVGAVLTHLSIDTIRRAAQGELAQRDQVALAEEVAHRALGLCRQIHLAVAQAVQQFLGRQIDERHFVSAIEHAIGHRLPHANAGDAPDHVVHAFQMLHVDGRVHVDARVQQFLHVLPAFRVTRALDVRMREFVDEQQLRFAREGGVEVELRQHLSAIVDARKRQGFEAVEQRKCFLAAMRFDHADDDIAPVSLRPARGLQHRVGLAHARRCAEEQFQAPAPALLLFALELVEQVIGVGAGHRHCSSWLSCVHGLAASSARLSFSTFTRGSPMIPNWRPAVACATSASTWVTVMPRAFATRVT